MEELNSPCKALLRIRSEIRGRGKGSIHSSTGSTGGNALEPEDDSGYREVINRFNGIWCIFTTVWLFYLNAILSKKNDISKFRFLNPGETIAT